MTTSIANRALAFILAAIVALVVFGLFAVAMQTGVGMMILLVLCAGALSAIMLVAFRGFTATRLTWQTERNRHDEAVLKLGHDPNTYQLIERQAQLPAPVQAAPQLTGAKGIQFGVSVETNAVNLLLFSVQLLGRESNRIASNPECAAANIIGYNGRKWDAIINGYLSGKLGYEIATQSGPVANGGGAFVPENIGTVGALYDALLMRNNRTVLDSAVNALSPRSR